MNTDDMALGTSQISSINLEVGNMQSINTFLYNRITNWLVNKCLTHIGRCCLIHKVSYIGFYLSEAVQ